MDYNKLMEELDKEVLSSFGSTSLIKGFSATEGYDEVEKDLMEELEEKKPIVEVEGEDDLVFEEEGESSQAEEPSPEEIFSKAVNDYFTGLINDGIEAEEAVEKVLDVVNSVLPKEEGEAEKPEEVEVEPATEEPAQESQEGGETVTPDNYTEDPEKQKEILGNTVKGLSDEMDMDKALSSATESASFEEYQKDKEAKMLKRYKQLANKDEEKKKVAIEGLGELDISIDDRAISRVSGEYGYSGKNLRKMVAEAIQRGEI